MEDLSAWDFAENFSGEEAAALILGLQPTGLAHKGQIQVVLRRMVDDYHRAVDCFRYYGYAAPAKQAPTNLLSYMLDGCMTFAMGDAKADAQLLETRGFEGQRFEREELTRWLSAIGMASRYAFDRPTEANVKTRPSPWPWGDYETGLLRHLAAAAERFWMAYDPEDPATAKTNEIVAEWLESRGVAKRVAEVMAQILRADGLRTGPRLG
ncbi:MAG: hypothetical protein EPN34_07005 [Burkholderiaceae bacterium]|nr:MAG: hypothetical protein EPN34_07005 [Burkholderiaceae bacterium]